MMPAATSVIKIMSKVCNTSIYLCLGDHTPYKSTLIRSKIAASTRSDLLWSRELGTCLSKRLPISRPALLCGLGPLLLLRRNPHRDKHTMNDLSCCRLGFLTPTSRYRGEQSQRSSATRVVSFGSYFTGTTRPGLTQRQDAIPAPSNVPRTPAPALEPREVQIQSPDCR